MAMSWQNWDSEHGAGNNVGTADTLIQGYTKVIPDGEGSGPAQEYKLD